jgi:ribonuclease R
MTYTEANDYLSNGKKITPQQEVLKSLDYLNEAALFFRKHRSGRGSMDFDLPEPEIVLDLTGKPENVVKADRNIAHMLIEDLMIAANEAVAVYLSRKGYPCIYRIHDRPNSEKLMELKVLLKYLGHNVKIGRDPTPARLSKVVRVVKDRPEERLINMLLLRSMSQAEYSIKNIGHFGLASPCYCHFTSPIRRYPDLLVHRLLGDAIGSEKYSLAKSVNYLKEEAKHSSKMERKAMEAERESLSLYSAIFMRDKIGEIYDGLVSHTAKKGVFVELIDYFVEGLIKPEDLHGDYFRFDQKKFAFIGRKTGKSIHIGDRIRVIVKDVSIEERRVYFEPAD